MNRKSGEVCDESSPMTIYFHFQLPMTNRISFVNTAILHTHKRCMSIPATQRGIVRKNGSVLIRKHSIQ